MTVEDDNGGGAKLFTQSLFHIIRSESLNQDEADKIEQTLRQHGAENVTVSSQLFDAISLDDVTHIVTTTIDFPDHGAAFDSLKAIVKPDWVSASVTKGRLANPRQYSPDPRMFFSGLIVCCADLPSGDSDAIVGGVLAMGGLYSSPVTKSITHIVALTMDNDKCQAAISKHLKCKIVLPHWFDDCLKLGKRIDESPYCLPDPEILRKKPEDRIPDAGRSDLQGASSAQAGPLPTLSDSPSANRRQLTTFNGKRVMLSEDLGINIHLRGTIEDLIINGGGMMTASVYKADYFVCQYRESLEYRIAARAGKDVGNLPWLYHLITHNTWTSPLKRLLHHPMSKSGIPGFKHLRISLSNYNGEARVYLENLAKAAGGEFTKTMKEDNTHLITAHMVSEKCDAAKEWNIAMINHLWLEESYAKWQIQTLSNTRYTSFPPRTNLGEIVGQTPIDKQALERYFFPPGSDIDPALEAGVIPRPVSVRAPNVAPSSPMQNRAVNVSSSAVAHGNHNGGPLSDGSTPKASRERRRHTDGNTMRTPASSRFVMGGKENETPSTTGSRSAKEKAAAKLHDLAPDIALFDKEMKRVGGVTHGGRKTSEDKAQNVVRKRSMSNGNDTDTGVDEEAKAARRAKKARSVGPPALRLALSGYKRWVGTGMTKKESEERAILRDMGILVVDDHVQCTHLASPKIVRTQKFICGVAHAPIILSTDYIDDCLKENRRLDPEDYHLQDEDGEKRLGNKLTDSIDRAKRNKGRLLQDFTIYCTEGVHGGFDTYKAIVEANGGKCLLYRARAGLNATARAGTQDKLDSESGKADKMYLISSSGPEDAKLWPKFRQMVQGIGKVPMVVRNDWIVDMALSQELQWHDVYSLADKDIGVEMATS